MTPARVYAVAAVLFAGGLVGAAGHAALATDTPTPAPTPVSKEARPTVPHAKFRTAVLGWRAARAEVESLRRSIATAPDAELSLQIAGIVYRQDWRSMQRCWLSEGYRHAERRQRRIVRLNTAGSGASGPAQFMPSAWRGTPFGHLDIFNVQAQAFATAWMRSQGRGNEWTGVGC